VYANFKKFYERIRKPTDLAGVKQIADSMIDAVDQEPSFRFGMSLFSVPPKAQNQILERWLRAGKPAIKEFVPYFRHVLSVDLFFYSLVFRFTAPPAGKLRVGSSPANRLSLGQNTSGSTKSNTPQALSQVRYMHHRLLSSLARLSSNGHRSDLSLEGVRNSPSLQQGRPSIRPSCRAL
jgi:hypothetical protein